MGIPKIIILETLLERLKEVNTSQNGGIYGIMFDCSLYLIGICFESNVKEDFTEKVHLTNQRFYAAGIDWCGLFESKDDIKNSTSNIVEKLKDVAVTNNPVYFLYDLLASELIVSNLHNDRLITVDYEIISEEALSNLFLCIRMHSNLTISVKKQTIDNLLSSLQATSNRFTTGSAMYHFNGTNMYLHPCTISAIPNNLTLDDLYGQMKHVKCCVSGQFQKILNVSVISNSTSSIDETSGPLIHHETGEMLSNFIIRVPIDFLCIVNKKRLVIECYEILTDALYRCFELIQTYFTKFTPENWIQNNFRICHFNPKPLGHYVSFVFPAFDDKDTIHLRKYLHLLYQLSFSKPYFRLANVLFYATKGVLNNVHNGVRHSRVADGKVSMITGNYGYYHYLQDGYDDRGWGCAYRSFQTIFSWFRLQGYTSKDIPLHKEMQKCLVKIGDKPSSFVGTKSWIGSTELSFCLSEMIGVNSIILNVSNGTELPSFGLQLQQHFLTCGTPVMIGGCNLAHTILGVDFNENTGSIKYLILDPHYVSPTEIEDIKHIQTKGGVFWIGNDFWSKNDFYNLCLPQLTPMF